MGDQTLDMFDLADAGWHGAKVGMQRATDHAEREAWGWTERAGRKLREYLVAHPGTTFIAPQVRAWAERAGLDAPATNFAWGGVFQRASRAGLIRRMGYTQYGDGVMHTQSVAVWSAAGDPAQAAA